MKELFKALAEVHKKIKNPTRDKEVTIKHTDGKGQHKFKYAPLDKIIDDVRPILAQNGFSIFQSVEPIDGKDYIITQMNHSSGDFIRPMLPFGAIPTDPKLYGGRLTYMKRYALCAALNISAEDDNDAPDKMTGKFNRSKLKSEIAKFNHGVGEYNKSEELAAHYNEFKEAIDQAKIDIPELITGIAGENVLSVEDHYKNTMTALIMMEKQEKENTEKFKNTV